MPLLFSNPVVEDETKKQTTLPSGWAAPWPMAESRRQRRSRRRGSWRTIGRTGAAAGVEAGRPRWSPCRPAACWPSGRAGSFLRNKNKRKNIALKCLHPQNISSLNNVFICVLRSVVEGTKAHNSYENNTRRQSCKHKNKRKYIFDV